MKIKHITDQRDLENAFQIRKSVFVKEQNVPEEVENDQYDDTADHILVYYKNQPVATGRMRIIDEGIGKLERICVLKQFRKLGLGKAVINGLEQISEEKKIKKLRLDAQSHARNFYLKLGYKQISEEFLEEGIPHVLMTKKL